MRCQVASAERSGALRSSSLSLANLLDGVQIGREHTLGRAADCLADERAFVAAKIVHDDVVAKGERRRENWVT